MRAKRIAAVTAAATSLALVGAVAAIASPDETGQGGNDKADTAGEQGGINQSENARLAAQLRTVLQKQGFDEVLDTVPPGSETADQLYAALKNSDGMAAGSTVKEQLDQADAEPIHQAPNVDLAVIELNDDGQPTAAANLLSSPQYPNGKVVPLDEDIYTDQVRYRTWDDATWDENEGQGVEDALPGREDAPIDFMAPYPASVMKLMVGFGVLQLVDEGKLDLDEEYTYEPGEPAACGDKVTKPVRQFFDEMITVSNNDSTCAMVKLLWDHDAVEPLNQTFGDLGMPMLQLNDTRASDGGGWANNEMSSLDTAKLLLLIEGGSGTLWSTPDGGPVTADVLSDESREFFRAKLADQGLNQVLSTTNWCGRDYPAQGIAQRTADRWIDPDDGTMTVEDRIYGQDVRPCQESAEVSFEHKTGLLDTSGNDAGIVHALEGADDRDYIIVVNSNLGNRYVDEDRPDDPTDIYPVQYSEKYAVLGAGVDDLMTERRDSID